MGDDPIVHNTGFDSTPYDANYYNQSQKPPPPPPSSPGPLSSDELNAKKMEEVRSKINEAIAEEAVRYLKNTDDKTGDAAYWVKQRLLPLAYWGDIVSIIIRASLFLCRFILPDLYNLIQSFGPIYYAIYGTFLVCMVIGIAAAFYGSGQMCTAAIEKRATAHLIPQRRKRNEQMKFYAGQIRFAGFLFCASIGDLLLLTAPYIIKDGPLSTPIAQEVIALFVPIIATAISLLSSNESRADAQGSVTAMGTAGSVNILLGSITRLANHTGTFMDSAAVQSAMSGDLMPTVEAGVGEVLEVEFYDIGYYLRMLGLNDAKESAERRSFQRVAAAQFTKKNPNVRKDKRTGAYLVAENVALSLFHRYIPKDKHNILQLPVEKKKARKGLAKWIYDIRSAINDSKKPQKPLETPGEKPEKIVALREVNS
jgi:hypothetical protein